MTTMEALKSAEINERLIALPEWYFENNAIIRTTTFPSFMRAIEFVNALAHLAERHDHHPDIIIVYHRVTIRYWTHRAKGVTHLDFDSAAEVEPLVAQFKKGPNLSQNDENG